MSFGEINDERTYQRVVGVVGRLWDQDSLIVRTLREVILANIGHHLSPGQKFGRHVILETS